MGDLNINGIKSKSVYMFNNRYYDNVEDLIEMLKNIFHDRGLENDYDICSNVVKKVVKKKTVYYHKSYPKLYFPSINACSEVFRLSGGLSEIELVIAEELSIRENNKSWEDNIRNMIDSKSGIETNKINIDIEDETTSGNVFSEEFVKEFYQEDNDDDPYGFGLTDEQVFRFIVDGRDIIIKALNNE